MSSGTPSKHAVPNESASFQAKRLRRFGQRENAFRIEADPSLDDDSPTASVRSRQFSNGVEEVSRGRARIADTPPRRQPALKLPKPLAKKHVA